MKDPRITEFEDLARDKDMKDQKVKRDELLHVATQLAAGLLFCSLVDMDEELLSEVAVLQAKSLIKKVDEEFE